jgi:hypothetical protein
LKGGKGLGKVKIILLIMVAGILFLGMGACLNNSTRVTGHVKLVTLDKIQRVEITKGSSGEKYKLNNRNEIEPLVNQLNHLHYEKIKGQELKGFTFYLRIYYDNTYTPTKVIIFGENIVKINKDYYKTNEDLQAIVFQNLIP